MKRLSYIWIILCLPCAVVECFHGENAKRSELARKANKEEPPFQKGQNRSMEIGLMPRRIYKMDYRSNTLVLDICIYFSWYDHRLTWTGESYMLSISNDLIWRPNFRAYNRSVDDTPNFRNCVILQDGHVFCSHLTTTYNVCVMRARYFPFDQQTCQIVLGFWNTQGESPDLFFTSNEGDERWNYFFRRSSKWTIERFSSSTKIYGKIEELKYPVRIFEMILQRACPQLALIILCPSLMSLILGLLVFWISPKYPLLRFGLTISGMIVARQVSVTALQITPSTGEERPLIVDVAVFSFILLLMSSGHTMVTTFLLRKTSPLPKWIVVVCNLKPSNWLLTHWFIQESKDINNENLDEKLSTWESAALLLDVSAFFLFLFSWIILTGVLLAID